MTSTATRTSLLPALSPRPDPRRRRLLFGLPASLAFGSPFAFVACGGGGDDAATPATSGTPVVSTVPVTVTAPAGVSLAGAKVGTFHGSGNVGSDGKGQVGVLDGGPQWTTVTSAAGKPMLWGWVSTGQAQVSTRSTAEVLLYLRGGGFLLPAELRGRYIGEIAARTDLAALEAAIAATLAQRGELDLRDARIEAAGSRLLPRARSTATSNDGGRARALSVVVDPGGQVSGLSVLNEGLDQIRIQNQFRRRAVGVIERVAYKMAGAAEQSVSPPKEVWVGEVAPMTMQTSLTGTVSNALADWANGTSTLIENYTSPYAELPLEPEGAEYAVYRVSLAGAGIADGDATGWTDAKDRLRLVTVLKTIFLDIIAPLVIGQILPAISNGFVPTPFPNDRYHASVLAITTLLDTVINVEPAVFARLDEGDVGGAVLLGVQAIVTESTVRTALLVYLYQYAIGMLGDGKVQGKLFEMLPAVSEGEFVSRASSVFSVLGLVNQIMGAADLALWTEGVVRSNKVDTFTVKVAASKLTLSPKSATVGSGTTTALTAKLLDPPSNPDALVTYRWTLAGDAGGTLRNTTSGATGATMTTSSGIVEYVAADDAANGRKASISVEALLQVQASGAVATTSVIARSEAPAVLTIGREFTLKLLPAGTIDVPANDGIDLIALVNEALPAGATVEWQWSVSGAGSLGTPNKGAVRYLSANADGTGKVSVRATIGVPAAGEVEAHTVVTDAVSVTLNVKKGLKQIVMEVGGGTFGCTDTKACGVSEYTAFIVPRYAKAISYRAVLSGYGYPGCNRSVTWNSPVGDGGDCNFPVTYHPHSSQGATNLWAVWIGFGGAISGKCVVTITLTE